MVCSMQVCRRRNGRDYWGGPFSCGMKYVEESKGTTCGEVFVCRRGFARTIAALLMPPDLREWVREGHLAHHVSDMVEALDLRGFYERYEGDRAAQLAVSIHR